MSRQVEPTTPQTQYTTTADDMMQHDAHTESAPSSTIRVKRRLNVSISGSLQNFSLQGPTAGVWKPVEGKHADVFGVISHNGVSMDHGALTNSLRNAMILKTRILEQKSNFPVALGVHMSCVTPEEVTDTGEKYVATVLPNSTNTTPLTVFETDASTSEGIEWRKKYPSYNSSNLETWGVMEVKQKPYIFVHVDHPAIALLRVNADLLGSNIDEHQLLDGQWYKVTRQVFSTCCNSLRNKVLSRVATRDLNQFSVQLHRLGEQDWADLGDGTELLAEFTPNPSWTAEQAKDAEAKYIEVMLKKPCTYAARIEVEYEIQP
jgi:hypothetical protein